MTNKPINQVIDSLELLIETAKQAGFSPHDEKVFRRFTTTEVTRMIGKSTTTIYNAENEGVINKPEINPETGRRLGYELSDINSLRRHYDIRTLYRPKGVSSPLALRLAVYNFKGGVGKTTTAVCYSQYLAMLGYRVLLVDMDAQASASTFFGIFGDLDLDEAQTIVPYILSDDPTDKRFSGLSYAIQSTHVDGIDIIPASQVLSEIEFESVPLVQKFGASYFNRLSEGLDLVADDYDFIIIDAPPSLGVVGLQTILSVDNLIVPCPARMLDTASTQQFLIAANNYVEQLMGGSDYLSIHVIATMFQKRAHESFFDLMKPALGDFLVDEPMLQSQTYDEASTFFKTPYEVSRKDRRVIDNMNSIFNTVTKELIERNFEDGN